MNGRLHLTIILLFLLTYAKAGTLSGTYSIDPAGSGAKNFTSFKLAAKALKDSGISGPVIFEAADGLYKESFKIDAIKGSSAVNTVTFQSKSMDSTKVVLSVSLAGDYVNHGYVVLLNGCRYVTIKGMTLKNIISTSPGYGDVVGISGDVKYITVERCRIITNYGFTISNLGYGFNGNASSRDSFISIINNHFTGGQYGIFLTAKADSLGEYGNVILQNTIDSSRIYAIYTIYQDSMTISKNTIIPFTQMSGMSINNTRGVSLRDSSYIVNNFVDIMYSGGTAIIATDNNMLNVFNNTFVASSAGTASTAYFMTKKGTNIPVLLNNIFVNRNTGYAFTSYKTGTLVSDYNDFYTGGTVIANWDGTDCPTLSDLQSNSALEAHSVSTDPNFKNGSTGNLHLTSSSLGVIHKALVLSTVPDDIDGDKRSLFNPSIGADDVPPALNDAAIEAIDSAALLPGVCWGSREVWARLGNQGSNTLSSATISWEVDGKTMPSVSWAGTLATGTHTLVKLGAVKYLPGIRKSFTVWSGNPNGTTDGNTSNDTNFISSGGSLKGKYTVGGTGPDFRNFREAANALNTLGVCGATIFNVRDGRYNESVKLKYVKGTSKYNTVTFQSESQDSSKVVLDTTFGGPTLYLIGSTYFNFNKLTIVNNSTNGASYAVTLTLNTGFITFSNNQLKMPVGSTPGRYVFNNIGCNNLTLQNNLITGGYYSINNPGTSAFNIYNTAIFNNTLDSAYNTGIYPPYCDSLIIYGNRIFMPDVNSKYGIYVYYTRITGTADSSCITNNFITIKGTYSNAIQVIGCPQFNIYNNTMYVVSDNQAFYYFNLVSRFYTYYFYNNIVYNTGKGGAVYMRNLGTTYADNNDLYSAGTALAFYSLYPSATTTCNTLKDWIKASGLDSNSISAKVTLAAPNKNDLHIAGFPSPVARKGRNLTAVRDDIDGDPRSRKPDLGADQFSRDSNDIGIKAIVSPKSLECGTASAQVGVKVSNFGYNDASGFNVHIEVSGPGTASKVSAFPAVLRGYLKTVPHDTIMYFTFSPALNTLSGGKFIVKAYTDLASDTNHNNDTTIAIIEITPIPVASFRFAKSPGFCTGEDIAVVDTSTAGYNHFYRLVDSKGAFVDSSLNTSPAFAKPSVGQYRVWLEVDAGGGCTDTTSAAVFVSDSPYVKFGFSKPCPGSTVNFMDSSAAGSGSIKSYSWDFGNGKSALGSSPSTTYPGGKTYTVTETVTNSNGCSASASRKLTVNYINTLFTSTTPVSGQVDFTANDSSFAAYSWDYGDKSAAGSGSKSKHTYSANGRYLVTLQLTDANGCVASRSDSVIISNVITGLEKDMGLIENLSVYPNPFREYTTISYSLAKAERVKIEVTDMTGHSIKLLIEEKQPAGDHSTLLDAAELKSSVYILKIIAGERTLMRPLIVLR